MRSVNRVVLMGYLATDPQVKDSKNGHKMATFKLATNRDWKGSDGERHEVSDFHKIVVWNKLGEVCGKYLKKGAGIYIEGRIANYVFKDTQGKDRKTTEIVADMVNFVTYNKGKDGEELNLVEVAV